MGAPLEVRIDLSTIAGGQAIAYVGAQAGHTLAAFGDLFVAQVRLQICLAQAFASSVGQSCHGIRRQPQDWGDLGDAATLYLGVPQHQLPPFRQGGEGRRGERAVLLAVGSVEQGHIHFIAHVGRRFLATTTNFVVEHVAHGGDQIGAERHVGSTARLQRPQHPGERLRRDVVRVGVRLGQRSSRGARGLVVPAIQLAK